MHITRLSLENFRAIPQQTLNFADELGRVNPVTLIVGPNGSGKSSILDAVWLGLQRAVGYADLRDMSTAPENLVKIGTRFARLVFDLRISSQESERLKRWRNELVALGDLPDSPPAHVLDKFLEGLHGSLEWTLPTQPGYDERGYRYPNRYDWALLQGKNYARRLRRLQAYNKQEYHLAGGIYLFEQERRIVAQATRSISPDEVEGGPVAPEETPNIFQILVNLGIKSRLGRLPPHDDWYKNIQEAYQAICYPRRMGEVYASTADGSYNIDFNSEGNTYTFYGLSSGEPAVLNFLVQYFTKRMFHSIVLIDELELSLHPTWQRRLLRYLARRDDGNQFIMTTHSPALRAEVDDTAIIDLGLLDDTTPVPSWQLGGDDT